LRAECPALTVLIHPPIFPARWGLAMVSCPPRCEKNREQRQGPGLTAMVNREIDGHLTLWGSANPSRWTAKTAMTSPTTPQMLWSRLDGERRRGGNPKREPARTRPKTWTQHQSLRDCLSKHRAPILKKKKTSWNRGAKISCTPGLHRNPASGTPHERQGLARGLAAALGPSDRGDVHEGAA
jgi:hypothetical protein